MEPKVIIADWGYEGDGSYKDRLVAWDVSELPNGVINQILELILKSNPKALKDFNNKNDYYQVDQIKEKEGWSVTNKDKLFITTCDRYSDISYVQKFDEDYLEKYIKSNGSNADVSQLRVFTEVSLPETIQKQIDTINQRLEKEKQEKEIKKAEKRLEKAKKILENNGKLL